MMTKFALVVVLVLLAVCSSAKAQSMAGVWEAHRHAGPEVQGTLHLRRQDGGWQTDIAGYRLNADVPASDIRFEIPGDRGRFVGRLDSDSGRMEGHWIQPGIMNNGMRHASAVTLDLVGYQHWRGEVRPLASEFSLYLPVTQRDDGSLGTFLRNPDRGFGVFYNLDRLEVENDTVRWIGRFFRNPEVQVLATARMMDDSMVVRIRGNLFDLRRSPDPDNSLFYARGRDPEPWQYLPPPATGDGWPVGTLDGANIQADAIGRFIDSVILPPADGIDDPYLHGFLIARNGRLVLEEYFHGFHRDKPHDTRSASKSLTAVLAGAAIHAGHELSLDTPVYATISRETPDDRRAANLTLRHLLTMSSGLDCDDGDGDSPGNEDTMQSQEDEPDWYRYTLALDMIRDPGERAVYCSAGMNLAGNVLSSATGLSLMRLFHELIAEPLQANNYHLNLSPAGVPYMGGGIYWRPRDFMKLAQLMLNGGTWNGRRVLSESFARDSVAAQYPLQNKGYGYAWWTTEYPWADQTVKAFFAAGNGGQIIMGIPALDLVVAFYAGNYSHRTLFRIQEEFVPTYILPAVVNQPDG